MPWMIWKGIYGEGSEFLQWLHKILEIMILNYMKTPLIKSKLLFFLNFVLIFTLFSMQIYLEKSKKI